MITYAWTGGINQIEMNNLQQVCPLKECAESDFKQKSKRLDKNARLFLPEAHSL